MQMPEEWTPETQRHVGEAIEDVSEAMSRSLLDLSGQIMAKHQLADPMIYGSVVITALKCTVVEILCATLNCSEDEHAEVDQQITDVLAEFALRIRDKQEGGSQN